MKEIITTVTRKGQVTIPAEIRHALGLQVKSKVAFIMEGDEVRLKVSPSIIDARFGVVKPKREPEDFAALREEFEKGVAEEVAAEG